jgi:hypothetical protein
MRDVNGHAVVKDIPVETEVGTQEMRRVFWVNGERGSIIVDPVWDRETKQFGAPHKSLQSWLDKNGLSLSVRDKGR